MTNKTHRLLKIEEDLEKVIEIIGNQTLSLEDIRTGLCTHDSRFDEQKKQIQGMKAVLDILLNERDEQRERDDKLLHTLKLSS